MLTSLLLSLAAAGDPIATTSPNVILVCWDTVRADRLTPYGYRARETTPFLADLASSGLVLEDVWASSGWTKPSVSSFLSGLPAASHGVYEGSSKEVAGYTSDVLAPEATTLAEHFRAVGYQTAAFVRNGHLRPGLGLEQGFDTYVDRAGDAREIRWRALDWLDGRDHERPFFLYLHCLDAHWPYDVPDEAAARFAPLDRVERFRDGGSKALFEGLDDGELPFTPADAHDLAALYDATLRYLDEQLAALFLGLEQRGVRDDLVFALVSDHGESFGEGGRFGHGHGLSPELLAVPFVLTGPDVVPGRSSAPASLLDLAPSLLAAARLPVPPGLPGVDRIAERDRAARPLAEHKAPDRYLAVLRGGGRVVERDVLAPKGSPTRIGLDPGDRVEIQLERDDFGGLVAADVEESDDPPGDPLELKGQVRSLTADLIEVEGLVFPFADGWRTVYEEGAEGLEIEPGRMVKLRLEGGPPAVTRCKLYTAETERDFELRGPVEHVEGDLSGGTLRVAGVDVRIGEDTDIEADDSRRFEREALETLLVEDAAALAARGFEFTERTYDLRGLERIPSEEAGGDLFVELDRSLREAWAARMWSTERRVLEDEAVDLLRQLGYVK